MKEHITLDQLEWEGKVKLFLIKLWRNYLQCIGQL